MSNANNIIINLSDAMLECFESKNKITKSFRAKTSFGLNFITSIFDISMNYQEEGIYQTVIATVTTNLFECVYRVIL